MKKYFNAVWAWRFVSEFGKETFVYDNKLYVVDQGLFWLNTQNFCRHLTNTELEILNGYLKEASYLN